MTVITVEALKVEEKAFGYFVHLYTEINICFPLKTEDISRRLERLLKIKLKESILTTESVKIDYHFVSLLRS